MQPETRFARTTDGTHVAYQVTGDGPVDMVLLRAWFSDMEHEWQEPRLARFYRRLESVARLIRLDRRGMGLSDRRAQGAPVTLEETVDDIRTVMDAAGSHRAVLAGLGDGATNCALFAATHPERTLGLVLYGPFMRWQRGEDFPWGDTPAGHAEDLDHLRLKWGVRDAVAGLVAGGAPSRANDQALIDWFTEQQRRTASPEEAVEMANWFWQTDATAVLESIHVPTLVLMRAENESVDEWRHIAARIPDARVVEVPGEDLFVLAGDTDAVVREMQRFVESLAEAEAGDIASNRVLATVLFTDLVASTERAAEMGDRAWADVLSEHHRRAAVIVQRHRGRVIDTAGDGILASFDGPGRAIRCALGVIEDARAVGLEARAGLHTGECELDGDRLRGLAVHIGARVAALAGPSEVLASSTVKDLVAGSGLEFEDRGARELKGVPGEWRIFAVAPE